MHSVGLCGIQSVLTLPPIVIACVQGLYRGTLISSVQLNEMDLSNDQKPASILKISLLAIETFSMIVGPTLNATIALYIVVAAIACAFHLKNEDSSKKIHIAMKLTTIVLTLASLVSAIVMIVQGVVVMPAIILSTYLIVNIAKRAHIIPRKVSSMLNKISNDRFCISACNFVVLPGALQLIWFQGMAIQLLCLAYKYI